MNAMLADRVGAIAIGTLRGQRFVQALRTEQAIPAETIEEVKQLQIEHGVDSVAVAAFLAHLAKCAAR